MKPPTKTALFAAAKRWDAAAVAAILAAAPGLAKASDPRGRMALHLACAVKPGAAGLAERDGTATAGGAPRRRRRHRGGGADGRRRGRLPRHAGVVRDRARREPRASCASSSPAAPTPARACGPPCGATTPSFCGALLAAKPRLNLIAHGETPLFYAARLKRLKTLALLIEAGADPSIPDRQGRDAVAIARARRLPKPLIARLEEARARI